MKALRANLLSPTGICFLSLVVLPIANAVSRADEPAERGKPAGKLLSAPGTLLERTGKTWQVLPAQGNVSTGSLLLALPGERAEVQSQSGAVQLSLWGNLLRSEEHTSELQSHHDLVCR